MIIAKVIKLRGKTVHNNIVKRGSAGNFEPKIRTVPLKVGQLESMLQYKWSFGESGHA